MSSKQSRTWEYFKKISSNSSQCQVGGCARIISIKGGNTTGMKNHLKIHSICNEESTNDTAKENDETPLVKKSRPNETKTSAGMLSFIRRESLDEIIAKCAAKDGISFNTIVKCEAIRGYVTNRNYKMPTSSTTVQKCVIKFFEEKKAETRELIENKIKTDEKFTITVDEWTDIAMRRYLNVTLHSIDKQIVLGLVPIIESCTSEKTEELVSNRLAEFGVNFTQDIVASTHDGASVMVKYGRIISAESQCCFNHAIHLSVVEIFYMKTKPKPNNFIDIEIDCQSSEEESDEQDEHDIVIEDENEDLNECAIFRRSHDVALVEMRKIIKFFRKSALRSEILQKYVVMKEKKPLKLLLDVKTRWSSLVTAITRFLKLIDPINDAMEELGLQNFSTESVDLLKEIVAILEPVKLAVLELSKQSANLLTAEGTLNYVFQQLQKVNTPLAEEFKKSLKRRIDERRKTDITSLLMLLHNGVYPKSNEFFCYSSKAIIKALAIALITRLFPSGTNLDTTETTETESEETCEKSEYLQLQKCIADVTLPTPNSSYCLSSIEKELKLLEVNKDNRHRSGRLQKLYKALLTVKPTSTASERVFSVGGIFVSKLRNRMGTATLNALVFLKYYFSNKQ